MLAVAVADTLPLVQQQVVQLVVLVVTEAAVEVLATQSVLLAVTVFFIFTIKNMTDEEKVHG